MSIGAAICREWRRGFALEKEIRLGLVRLLFGFVVHEGDESVPVAVDLYAAKL